MFWAENTAPPETACRPPAAADILDPQKSRSHDSLIRHAYAEMVVHPGGEKDMRVRNQAVVRAAFTLMEVLVVVAIIIVLAGAGGVIYMRYLDDAKKDRARIDLKALSDAVNTYKAQHGDLPLSLEQLTQRTADGGTAYIEIAALIDPWGRPYVYEPQNLHQLTGKPHLYSDGPVPGDPSSRISSWAAVGIPGAQ
jgi:general secretion pathway protein G